MIPALYVDSWHPAGLPVSLVPRGDALVFELILAGSSRQLTWKNTEVDLSYHKIDRSITLLYKADGHTSLQISSVYARQVESWLQARPGHRKRFTKLFSRSLLVGLLLIAISIIPVTYFVLLPVIADYIADQLPEKEEIQIGNQMAEQVLLSMKEVPARSAYCDSFVTALGLASKFPIHVHVVEATAVNAFSLPGGQVFVHTAMLNACKSKEELAALLGHEIGHIEMRHSAKAVMRGIITSAMVTFITGDFTSVAALAAGRANQMKNLEYSRELESNADEYSLKLLAKARLDPDGLVELFRTFEQEEERTSRDIPEMLRSHPLSKNRILDARNNIEQMEKYQVAGNETLQRYFTMVKSGLQAEPFSGQGLDHAF
jgi:predicted Zn-dependent protease